MSSGCILDPSTQIHTSGKTVLDILEEKHPTRTQEAAEKAYIICDDLPPLVDVDVAAAQVERVTCSIQGTA